MSRFPIPPLLLLLAGCLSASTEIPNQNDSGLLLETGETEVQQESGDSGDPADTEPTIDPTTVDDDGDGFSEEEGDCDDQNTSFHPNASDDCSGEDEDCDNKIDEDARLDDPYEATTGEVAYSLPSFADESDQSVYGILYSDDDVDIYQIELNDSVFDIFDATFTLSGIPTGAVYQLELERLGDGIIDIVDGDGTLEILIEDSWNGVDDGGTYQMTISAIEGADCSEPYLLSLEKTWI